MSSSIVYDLWCHMFLNVFALSKAFLEDQLVDDTTFIYELVDAVRILLSTTQNSSSSAIQNFADLRQFGKRCCSWRVRGTMWGLLSKRGVDETR